MSDNETGKSNKAPPPKVTAATSVVRQSQSAQAAPRVATYFWPQKKDGLADIGDLAEYLSQTENWPAEQFQARQLRQAAVLIRYAQRFAPFYSGRLAEMAKVPIEEFTAEMLGSIPVLTRADVQEAKGNLFSKIIPRGHGRPFVVVTTGSTGQPVQVKSTQFSRMFNAASTLRGHRWFGRDLGGDNVNIVVVKGDQGREKARGWASGSTGAAHIYSNRVPVKQLLDWLLDDDPHYLQCHPSILQELIHRSRDIGAKPSRLRDVRCMGEILDPALSELCQREWGVPVRDNYSCEELATLALTCPRHDHLHVQSERVLLEIIDDEGRPCAPGQTGRVVVTGLANFATPLIRYELGDRAIAGGACSTGMGLAVIDRVIGRERLPVILPSGDKVFPVLDAEPLLLAAGVRQYQLTQKSVDAIDIKIVANQQLPEATQADLISHLQHNFGYPFEIGITLVDEIPREPGGKFQIFKSEIA